MATFHFWHMLQAYGLPKEAISAIIMLLVYKKLKLIVCSPDSDTNIVAGILQGHTLVIYMSIILQDYVLWMLIYWIKENGFTLKKAESRWCPAETIMDADYANYQVLFANMSAQVKSLLYSLEQAAGGFIY